MGQHIITPDLVQMPSRKAVFGVKISDFTLQGAVSLLGGALEARRHMRVAFCNAHTANLAWEDESFRNTLAGFTIFADGLGIDVAARLLHGAAFKANLNGTDFIPFFLQSTARSLNIALIGGRDGVAQAAAERLLQLAPQHLFSQIQNGYGSDSDQQAFLAELVKEPADVLLVALGNPAQERWIAQHITENHAVLAVGVGALFDFLSNTVPRAPLLMRRMRLEWLYRLALEPRRLFGRYMIGNPLFIGRALCQRLGLRSF